MSFRSQVREIWGCRVRVLRVNVMYYDDHGVRRALRSKLTEDRVGMVVGCRHRQTGQYTAGDDPAMLMEPYGGYELPYLTVEGVVPVVLVATDVHRVPIEARLEDLELLGEDG